MQKSVVERSQARDVRDRVRRTPPVLRELFELLQDYAPTWYTEELHIRVASALGEMVLEPVS